MTNYAGIDYGMGLANIDPENGIRYGVIPANAEGLTEWIYDSFESDYGEPHCPKCGNPVIEGEGHAEQTSPNCVTTWIEHPPECEDWECSGCGDYRCDDCQYLFDGDEAFGDEPIGQYLDDGEYRAWIDSYNDIMLTLSPFYTHAQFCSPCAPGAGHLENPCPNGPKTYCFGHDWFDGGIAPYPVYRVSDGSIVDPA